MPPSVADRKALRLAVCKGNASKVAQHLKSAVPLTDEPAPSLLAEALSLRPDVLFLQEVTVRPALL